MKKALIVATVGGFAVIFEQNNMELLRNMGYELHYAADFSNHVYEFQDNFWSESKITTHQVDFVKKPFDIAGNLKAYRQLKQVIDKEKFSIIHCHTPVAAAITRAAVRNKKDVKVIYTAHGFHFYKGAPVGSVFYKIIEKMLARYTDVLITINSEDFLQAQKFVYKEGGHAEYIPGVGINPDKFVRTAAVVKKEAGEIFNIVSVGELNNNKNHITVIRAIALLGNKNIRYDIYGNGPLKEKLEQTIKLYKLEEQVRLCGYCNDTCRVLNNTDCFVFPSVREGLGMAAIEALACGVPVIALNQRGSREFLRDGENGYFCLNTPDSFAEAIKKVMALSQEDLERFALCAVDSSRKFDEKNTVNIMKRIYNDIDSKVQGV
ncbi:MAG: glycosyltransferase [Lachnospiraceae bacterium]